MSVFGIVFASLHLLYRYTKTMCIADLPIEKIRHLIYRWEGLDKTLLRKRYCFIGRLWNMQNLGNTNFKGVWKAYS